MADETVNLLRGILSHFPSNISFAFAYGSAVFAQKGNISPDNMIDFVFVVDNPYEWHKENLQMNPSHYSFLGSLGSGAIAQLQDSFGAGVYYNTLVHCGGRLIKYGVMSMDNFRLDMKDWKWLYVSGRLHKPVQIVQRRSAANILSLLEHNLSNAVNTALLCLPESFSEQDLFLTIAGLSYAGDFRMLVGEDKNKVYNIVSSNVEAFRDLYSSVISNSSTLHFSYSNSQFEQSLSTEETHRLLKSLPQTLLRHVLRYWFAIGASKRSAEKALLDIAKERHKCPILVRRGISSIVGYSSVTQSLKGVLTAGVIKTCMYSGQKLRKMFRGLLRT